VGFVAFGTEPLACTISTNREVAFDMVEMNKMKNGVVISI
jgi:hypothetical protein